jgi:hypothetical protein
MASGDANLAVCPQGREVDEGLIEESTEAGPMSSESSSPRSDGVGFDGAAGEQHGVSDG